MIFFEGFSNMTSELKKVILILSIIIFTVIISRYYTIYEMRLNNTFSCLNSQLYDLDIKMDLLEYLNNNFREDFFLEEKVKHLILNDLSVLIISNPEIERLKGTPLNAVYRLIQYSKMNELSLKNNSNAFKNGIDYLNKIENDVDNEMQKRKNLRKQFIPKNVVVPQKKG
jgi:hypothetical protein